MSKQNNLLNHNKIVDLKEIKIKCPTGCDNGYRCYYFSRHITCSVCGGYGIQNMPYNMKCINCKGVGTVPRPRERCPVCNGAGFIMTNN